ncbi:MAG: DUF4403 family protein [Nitrospira sp.]|nr:DUF4403 family protein [Nitrospira sp.]
MSALAPWAVLLLASWTIGCGGSHIAIPRPTDALDPPPAPPPVAPSTVNLTVTIPLVELAAAADEAMPMSTGQERVWQAGVRSSDQEALQYQYWVVRGPLNLRVTRDQLLSEFTEMQYRLALKMTSPGGMVLEGRCGYGEDPPKHMRLVTRTSFSWTEQWTLRTDTAFDPPEFRDSCRLAGLNADVTPIVRAIVEARLPALAAAIDKKAKERSETKQRAQKIWSWLQQPFDLGRDRWLMLNPQHAQASPIVSKGSDIRTSVDLVLKPQVHVGAKPSAEHRSLEPLRIAPAASDGFHLVIPVVAEYEVINRRLQERVVGQVFDSPVGEPLKISSAHLYGSGAQLIIELGVTGAMNGTLYATGQPVYDEEMRLLRFEHFDYTADTRNVVVRSADALFHRKILARIEPETRIDLSDRIDELRNRLASLLTREVEPGWWLEATVSRLNALGIYPVSGGVEVQIEADGVIEICPR